MTGLGTVKRKLSLVRRLGKHPPAPTWNRRHPLRVLRSVAFAAMMFTSAAAPAASQALHSPDGSNATVVYLVRHAEKVDDSRDPELSALGHERAAELARLLGDAGVDRVLSTDYIRTRDTAAPVATVFGLEVMVYDPSNLEGLATELSTTPGRHLVVGHSNTTPALVAALGGDPGSPIEESEYDRLYVVVFDGDDTPETVLLRFGAPSHD
jgi:phosphohistidine phosphatase SixA